EIDELAWMDTWAAWWGRHCLRAGSEGGLFPDLYVRRYRDTLEVSTGTEPVLGVPAEYVFLTPRRVYHVDPAIVAETLFAVLDAAVRELQRRAPQSKRLAVLRSRLVGLSATSAERDTTRMAWLAGLGDQIDRYRQAADTVDGALATAPVE